MRTVPPSYAYVGCGIIHHVYDSRILYSDACVRLRLKNIKPAFIKKKIPQNKGAVILAFV